ncbi:TetR/AcrR family transcriptional regulator [Paenibacillus xylanexedens]|uniref:TetR/AcrR family transcriptional regulator n=1 Tax=Paenibacillus xylanexedens TaxID=528191 RepID=UPI00119EE884|nr:TetR family transcriptional regulator [Paenibacillus xylanexedens]
MEKTLDPRFVRTRKLIMDAFMSLVMDKDFKNITIKDITQKATINRATFYYHFFDKYDLMETVLREDILQEVLKDVTSHEALSPKVLNDIFFRLISFQNELASQCKRSYEAFTVKIETVMKEAMSKAFKELLKQEYPTWSAEKLELHSIMISWSLYGMSIKFVKNGDLPSEDIMKDTFKLLLNVEQHV